MRQEEVELRLLAGVSGLEMRRRDDDCSVIGLEAKNPLVSTLQVVELRREKQNCKDEQTHGRTNEYMSK